MATDPTQRQRPKQTVWSALRVYTERPALVMIALGFSAGLPYFLIFDTLSAWFRAAGLSLEIIGFFSLVTLVSTFKFLWAPFVDRTRVPLLTTWLGHRRSWMLVCQALIMFGLWLIAGADPTVSLGRVAMFAVLVGLASATQDIAIDAWRIEAAVVSKQGAMAAAYQWGYRVAIIVAGAVPLLLATSYGWNFSYALMAGLMLIGVLAVLAAPREAQHAVRPIRTEGIAPAPAREALEWAARLVILAVGALVLGSGLAANAGVLGNALDAIGAQGARDAVLAAWRSDARVWVHLAAVLLGIGIIVIAALPLPGVRTRPGIYLYSALGDPLRDFFVRHRGTGGLILALICLYRVPDFVLNIMNPFYLDLGYTLVEIAEVRKIFGVWMTMFGVFLGGVAVARYGLMRSMVVGAFAGPVSNLLFIWLAFQPHNLWALFAAIGLDNVAGGFAGTCLIAYMSSLTSAGFTATQYALFSSLYAIPGRLIASQSGRIVESAARMADAGGVLSVVKGLFATRVPENFATAVERSGVTPAALGTGYVVFFVYSALIGVFAIALSFAVMRRQREEPGE
ncbi:MAG TPA: MFS transporter [Vicinamibacterales bacterium]|nr:MFS transporter [Vicinamibacterales bacterium]